MEPKQFFCGGKEICVIVIFDFKMFKVKYKSNMVRKGETSSATVCAAGCVNL